MNHGGEFSSCCVSDSLNLTGPCSPAYVPL